MGHVLAIVGHWTVDRSRQLTADRSRQLTSAGFTEEELCQNVHKRSPEEQRQILLQATERRNSLIGMTFEDWSHRLRDHRSSSFTQRSESAVTARGTHSVHDAADAV